MDIKKLNEELDQLLEDSINEISYETKKSYLAKRKAQLDAAQKAFDKANRMVTKTELTKNTDVKYDEQIFEKILRPIKDDFTYNDRRFGFIETFKDWAYMETGELSTDSTVSHCQITLAFKEHYLKVKVDMCTPWRQYQELFNMTELTNAKLINKAINYITKILKQEQKQFVKNSKINPKIQKVLEQIKNVLSRAKEHKFQGTKYERIIDFKLDLNGRRQEIPAVIPVTTVLESVKGFQKDLYVKAVGLNTRILKLALFYTENGKFDLIYLDNNLSSFDPEKLYKSLTEILDQLKGVKGKSTLKTRQKELEENKKIAAKAAEELRAKIKSIGGYGCEIERVKENGNSFEILTTDFGTWGEARDWEEDNDFMRPTKDTIRTLEQICKDFAEEYKTLKFTYGISEKRILSFYVDYTI